MPAHRIPRPSVIAGLVAAAILVPLSLQGPSPEDESALRAVVQRYVDAREARDAAAIAPLFTGDAISSSRTGRGGEGAVRPSTASRILAEDGRSPEHPRGDDPAPRARPRPGRRPLHADGTGGSQATRALDDTS